tara:strand:- start:143890 stop:144672 length:783 start_codon:yes stop_codon:yes gene_type:complete
MSVVALMRPSRVFHGVAVLLLSQFVALIASAEDRGFLGLQVQGMSPKIAAALQLDVQVGVMVRDISIDGPAAHAGIQRGDLIVKLNDQSIDTFERLMQASEALNPGDVIELEIRRQGEKETLQMTVGAWLESWQVSESAFAAQPELGLTFGALTPKLRKRMGVRWGTTGVMVTVSDDQFVSVTPLRRGDVVVQINQKPVWKPEQFLNAYSAAKKAGRPSLLMLVERSDGFKFMLQPVPSPDANNMAPPPLLTLPGQKKGG